jgi:hypothetical protein
MTLDAKTEILDALLASAPNSHAHRRFTQRQSVLWPFVGQRPGEDPLYRRMLRAKRSTSRSTPLALTNRDGWPVFPFGDTDPGHVPFIAAAAQLHLHRAGMYQLVRDQYFTPPWLTERGWVTTTPGVEQWYAFHRHLESPTGRHEWVLSHTTPPPAPLLTNVYTSPAYFEPEGYAVPRPLAALQLGISLSAVETLSQRGALTAARATLESDMKPHARPVYITYDSLLREHTRRAEAAFAPRTKAGRPVTNPPPWSLTTPDDEDEDES